MLLQIIGQPRALPRPRVTRGGRVYYPPTWKRYHRLALQQLMLLRDLEPITRPCSIHCTYLLPAPKLTPADPIHRELYRASKSNEDQRYPYPCAPDIDNLLKGTLDILQDARLLQDDRFVVTLSGQKYAVMDRSRCGVSIAIDIHH